MAYRSDRSWLGYPVAALAFIALLAHGEAAHASCTAAGVEVLWAYPVDGDVDVPVNAQLWVLTSGWRSSDMITLNGEPVAGVMQSFGGQMIDPGLLEADTDYVLELRFPVGSTDEQVITIAFHTASEPADAVSAPQTTGHTSATGHYESHACADVISAQDCFDTGQNTLLTVLTEDDDALGWVIKQERGAAAVWPARCGDPSLYSYADSVLDGCLLVRKIGPGGLLSEATRYCDSGVNGMNGGGGTEQMTTPPRSDDEPNSTSTAQSDSGCSVAAQLLQGRAGRMPSLTWWLGLLALVFAARRSARSQS